MTSYLLTMLTAAIVLAFVNILTPNGIRGGIASYQRLLTALLLVCILISPLSDALQWIKDAANGSLSFPMLEGFEGETDYSDQMNNALDASSKSYFTQMLTQTLSQHFSLAKEDMRCLVSWSDDPSESAPVSVTVILSGRAIWHDPQKIEAYVRNLLGCECITAID